MPLRRKDLAIVGGCKLLKKLFQVLESGQCHWVVLTEDGLEVRKKSNQD
jgi:hypothetical protein